MAKRKHPIQDADTARIIGQVERILEAGEKLREALRTERWTDRSSHSDPGATHRWLHTRAATDRAEAAYREAIDECYRIAETSARQGPHSTLGPGRETRPTRSSLKPIRHLFASL